MKKCGIKCQDSPQKKLTTQYKFCLIVIVIWMRTPNVRGLGGRLNADKGRGNQKLAKSCGHLLVLVLWMAPYSYTYT